MTWLSELIYGDRQLGVLLALLLTLAAVFLIALIGYGVVYVGSKWWWG